jgi:hypothetical protein
MHDDTNHPGAGGDGTAAEDAIPAILFRCRRPGGRWDTAHVYRERVEREVGHDRINDVDQWVADRNGRIVRFDPPQSRGIRPGRLTATHIWPSILLYQLDRSLITRTTPQVTS